MMRDDPVGGDSRSTVLGALKSRYSCLSEPLPPATAGGLDNDRRHLHPLWVFGSREVHPHSPPAASSFKPMLDLNITIDPQMIKDKIRAALSGLCFHEPRVLVQFWSPVTVQKHCSLMTLDQPFGLGAVDEGLYMYRLESEKRMFAIEEEHKEELGPPGRVYCQKLPEWSFGIHTLPVRQYVQDLAAYYHIHGYINLPVFEPDSGCCVGVLELITSSNCIDYAFEVCEVLRALKEENLRSSIVFQDHSFYVNCVHTQVRDERRQHELDEIQIKPSISAVAEGTGQSVIPCSDVGIEDFGINPGTTQRNRKKSVSSISLEEIEKHIGNPIRVAAASLNVSRSTLRRCCRNLSRRWQNRKYNDKSNKTIRKRKRTESSVGLMKINKKHYGRKTTKELLDILVDSPLCLHCICVVVVSRFVKRFRKSRGIFRRPYRNGLDKSDSRRKLGQTEILSSVFGERLCTKNGLATLTEHDKHSSTLVLHQQEPTEQYNENTAATNTVKILTIKATYGEEIAKFGFRISDGLVKLEELVAKRFQLNVGSFKLKYMDADGDLIWITCDIALTESVSEFRQTDHQTVIRLLVLPDEHLPVVHHSSNYEPFYREWDHGVLSNSPLCLHCICVVVVSRFVKRFRKSRGIFRRPYRNGLDKSDSRRKLGQTEIHSSVFGERLCTKNGLATLTEHDKHSSTLVLHQQEPTEQYNENTAATNTVKILTIKATYGEEIAKFGFRISDGLVKLEELVAKRFQLNLGSFKLKYMDADGDLIWIACDIALTESVSEFRQTDHQTVIRLLVLPDEHLPVVHHSSNV
ncbi:NIN-like protein [Artemisia annua]|uniref:NIN-like protein n=1 Tax=Artemisia annua TaxID=35608 RepID=A0A2U1N4P0_ARTAN|nr:NIN-like protein [Artemisia annua]